MHTSPNSSPPETNRTGRLWTAGLLSFQFVLLWATFAILSSAIDWPATLHDPASVALPRLLGHRSAVLVGYSLYLTAALLLVPATAALNKRLALSATLAQVTLGLAVLSALAKAIGIGRWLFAMPSLAVAYVSDQNNRSNIALIFETLNHYAGGIGEVLGVGLCTGVLTIMFGAKVLLSRERHGFLVGLFSLLAGASLLLTIPAGFGVKLGPVLAVTNVAWQFSMLFIAIWALQAPNSKNLIATSGAASG